MVVPGDSDGLKRLVGYSPWGHKDSEKTVRLTHTHGSSILSFLSNLHTIFHVVVPIYSPTNSAQGFPLSPNPGQHLLFGLFWVISILTAVR